MSSAQSTPNSSSASQCSSKCSNSSQQPTSFSSSSSSRSLDSKNTDQEDRIDDVRANIWDGCDGIDDHDSDNGLVGDNDVFGDNNNILANDDIDRGDSVKVGEVTSNSADIGAFNNDTVDGEEFKGTVDLAYNSVVDSDDEEPLTSDRQLIKNSLIEVKDQLYVIHKLMTIGATSFYYEFLSEVDGITLRIGDVDDKKGYFFCAGYIDNEKKEFRLFFLNKSMDKASNILLRNYLKLRSVRNSLKQDGQKLQQLLQSAIMKDHLEKFAESTKVISSPMKIRQTLNHTSYSKSLRINQSSENSTAHLKEVTKTRASKSRAKNTPGKKNAKRTKSKTTSKSSQDARIDEPKTNRKRKLEVNNADEYYDYDDNLKHFDFTGDDYSPLANLSNHNNTIFKSSRINSENKKGNSKSNGDTKGNDEGINNYSSGTFNPAYHIISNPSDNFHSENNNFHRSIMYRGINEEREENESEVALLKRKLKKIKKKKQYKKEKKMKKERKAEKRRKKQERRESRLLKDNHNINKGEKEVEESAKKENETKERQLAHKRWLEKEQLKIRAAAEKDRLEENRVAREKQKREDEELSNKRKRLELERMELDNREREEDLRKKKNQDKIREDRSHDFATKMIYK